MASYSILQGRGDGVEIGRVAVVKFVLHRGGDDAGRRRRHERLDEGAGLPVERGAEIATFRLDRTRIEIPHLADRLRRLVVADRLLRRQHLLHLRLQQRVALDIAPRPALPAVAKPAHPPPHVKEKRLALLLAVIADIDPGGDLLVDDPRQRRLAEPVELTLVDRLAAAAPDVKAHQFRRPRQAAGMRRQNPLGAPLHQSLPLAALSATPLVLGKSRQNLRIPRHDSRVTPRDR